MRVLRLRLWMLLVLVAAVGVTTAWGVHTWRRHLADDSGQFYTHEESAAYQAFQEAAATAVAAAGGAIIRPAFAFPGGRRLHFRDPNGNELAAWQPA